MTSTKELNKYSLEEQQILILSLLYVASTQIWDEPHSLSTIVYFERRLESEATL